MSCDFQASPALRTGQLRIWRHSVSPILNCKMLFVFEVFERNGIDWANCILNGRSIMLTAGTLLTDTVEVRDAATD